VIGRLANVIFWACGGVGVLCDIAAALVFIESPSEWVFSVIIFFVGVLTAAFGWSVRYVLTGRLT
jgi:uncharacterized membrane protein YczE